jgi:hypothetical protein
MDLDFFKLRAVTRAQFLEEEAHDGARRVKVERRNEQYLYARSSSRIMARPIAPRLSFGNLL